MSKRRNEVFNGPESDETLRGTPGIQTQELDFEIPVETVPLPSQGLAYAVDHPLHGAKTIEIKAMTAREEDILTSKAFIKKGTVITELLRSCLIDRRIDPNTLLSGDRNALMVAIRITGYGADYNVEVDCPSCGVKDKYEFNLAELPITSLGQEPVELGTNRFEFILPMTKKSVTFKFLTGSDEQEIMVAASRRKKGGMIADNLVTNKLQYTITSVDGNTDRSSINHFIRHMPARDSLALRRQMDKIEPGLEMKGWLDCISCDESTEVTFPLGASFFWPDTEQ
jgi:hypothetical protein